MREEENTRQEKRRDDKRGKTRQDKVEIEEMRRLRPDWK